MFACNPCFAYGLLTLLLFIVIVNCFVKASQESRAENVVVPSVQQQDVPEETGVSPLRRSQRLIDRQARE